MSGPGHYVIATYSRAASKETYAARDAAYEALVARLGGEMGGYPEKHEIHFSVNDIENLPEAVKDQNGGFAAACAEIDKKMQKAGLRWREDLGTRMGFHGSVGEILLWYQRSYS